MEWHSLFSLVHPEISHLTTTPQPCQPFYEAFPLPVKHNSTAGKNTEVRSQRQGLKKSSGQGSDVHGPGSKPPRSEPHLWGMVTSYDLTWVTSLSSAQFPHQWNGIKSSSDFKGLFWRFYKAPRTAASKSFSKVLDLSSLGSVALSGLSNLFHISISWLSSEDMKT